MLSAKWPPFCLDFNLLTQMEGKGKKVKSKWPLRLCENSSCQFISGSATGNYEETIFCMNGSNDRLMMSSFQSFFFWGLKFVLDPGHQEFMSCKMNYFDMFSFEKCHCGDNNWASFPVKMLRGNTNICWCQIAWTAAAHWQCHKKPMGCCIMKYPSEAQISFAHNGFCSCPIVLKVFTEHGNITAMLCENFKMIWQLKWMMKISQILQDFSLRWFLDGYPIL